jgi:hypothetical protein
MPAVEPLYKVAPKPPPSKWLLNDFVKNDKAPYSGALLNTTSEIEIKF